LLCVIQYLAGVVGVGERLADIPRDDGRVVEVVEQATAIFSQDNLLLCTFDGGCKV
jgi:hypothetical protein